MEHDDLDQLSTELDAYYDWLEGMTGPQEMPEDFKVRLFVPEEDKVRLFVPE